MWFKLNNAGPKPAPTLASSVDNVFKLKYAKEIERFVARLVCFFVEIIKVKYDMNG